MAHLQDGFESEYEDLLVADEHGLRNLIEACQEALATGTSLREDLGVYAGVKRLDPAWFEPEPEPSTFATWRDEALGVLGCVLFLGIFALGVVQAIELVRTAF